MYQRINATYLTGMTWWSLNIPQLAGGTRWYDLVRGLVGTLNGGMVPGSSTSGYGASQRPGGSVELRFDGSDDLVTTGLATSNFITASTGTLMCWYYPTGSAPSRTGTFYGAQLVGDATATGSWYGLTRVNISGTDNIWAYNWDSTQSFPAAETRVGSTYTNNVWTHWTWVHRASTLFFYRNGLLVGSTGSVTTGNVAQSVRFGGSADTATVNHLSGYLDDIHTWSRGLSDQEVLFWYEQSRLGYPEVMPKPPHPLLGVDSVVAGGGGPLVPVSPLVRSPLTVGRLILC